MIKSDIQIYYDNTLNRINIEFSPFFRFNIRQRWLAQLTIVENKLAINIWPEDPAVHANDCEHILDVINDYLDKLLLQLAGGGPGGPVHADDVVYMRNGFANVGVALDHLLYNEPAVTSFTGGGTYETGTEITSVTLNWTCNKAMSSIILGGHDSFNYGPGQNGTHTFTPISITSNTNYTINVTDGAGAANATTNLIFYCPVFHGTSVDPSLSGNLLYTTLTKTIESKTGTKSKSLNAVHQHLYFAFEGGGALTRIMDNNGYDVTSDFTVYTRSVTSSGLTNNWTRNFTVYMTDHQTDVDNKVFQFIF